MDNKINYDNTDDPPEPSDSQPKSPKQLIADEAYIDSLDSAAVGEDLQAFDYLLLLLLGIVIPIILLVWGWL